jgi:hypothetical protein
MMVESPIVTGITIRHRTVGTGVMPSRISVWFSVVLIVPLHQDTRESLPADRNDQSGVSTEGRQVRRQGAQQHVGLTLDFGHCRLSDAKPGGQLDLGQTGCIAYRGKVDHALILPSRNTPLKEYLLLGHSHGSGTSVGSGSCGSDSANFPGMAEHQRHQPVRHEQMTARPRSPEITVMQ